MKKIFTAALGVSAAVYTVLTLLRYSQTELCIGAMIVADVNFIAAVLISFGFRLAAENGYKNTAMLDRISSAAAAELFFLSIPLFLVPLFHENITETAFAVYVNIIGVVLFLTILIINKKF